MKYFGTDGIRQKAADFTPEFLTALVRGLVDYAGDSAKVLIGGDTRESTEWILSDLEKILESFGLEYASAGVLPTPAIHFCFSRMGFDLAIDVTASHNPYQDNGIKIFEANPAPQKLSPAGCAAVEKSLEKGLSSDELPSTSPTLREDLHSDALNLYLDHLRSAVADADFSGLRLGMDCANGAMSVIGDKIFRERGAEVVLINADSAYGKKINLDCGSTHLDSLRKLVLDQNLDFGVAFDGDGDRCLIVDETGAIIDGDQILAILTTFYNLPSFVTTVMANQGLLNWAKSENLTPEIADVGDSNVLALMREKHLDLGGEQSGHIILPGEPTGDGMLTALMVARAFTKANPAKTSTHSSSPLVSRKTPFSSLSPIKKLPQIMINFSATPDQKSAFLAATASSPVLSLLNDYEAKLSTISGRLLVRPSGTENLIRVTMWGSDAEKIETWANELAEKLGETLK